MRLRPGVRLRGRVVFVRERPGSIQLRSFYSLSAILLYQSVYLKQFLDTRCRPEPGNHCVAAGGFGPFKVVQ
jgi:hypothetical protein